MEGGMLWDSTALLPTLENPHWTSQHLLPARVLFLLLTSVSDDTFYPRHYNYWLQKFVTNLALETGTTAKSTRQESPLQSIYSHHKQ